MELGTEARPSLQQRPRVTPAAHGRTGGRSPHGIERGVSGALGRRGLQNTWHLLERRLAGATPKAIVALTLLDAYLMYRDVKRSQYVMAPYVLGDEQGFFTLEQESSLMSSRYQKAYLSGSAEGQRIEISPSDFRTLKEEAEALWGTTDWKGDFVPGLLNRELPVIGKQDSL